MLWLTFKRIIRAGFMNFTRNGFVSLAAVLIMVVTLFTIGSVMFLLAGLNSSLAEIREKVDISIRFTIDAPEEEILSVKKSLEALSSVSEIVYESREQVLESFKIRHQGDSLTLQALDILGTNPLGAKLNVRAKDPSQYESIANFLKEDSVLSKGASSIIYKIDYYDNKTAIDKLAAIISASERLGFAISIFLIVISIIISFNTIRLAIFVSREEISVMRLVGASNKYIRGPFVISGILYGVIAGIITLAIFYPITIWLGNSTANFFGVNFFSYYAENFGEFFAIVVGSGVVLGAISSFLAVRRYLKT